MTMDSKRDQTNQSQQRVTQRITLTTFLLMLVVAIVTLFFVASEDKTPLDNYMMPLIALSAGYSYYLARRGGYIRGIYILLGSIAVVSLAYPLIIKNIGWQTAFGMLLTTTGIANTTLPQKTAERISVAAFLFAFVIILIETFAPGLVEGEITTSSIIITSILGVIYLGFIFNRFSRFALSTKLIVFFITIAVFSVGTVAAVTNILTRNEITKQVGQTQQTLARRLALEIGVDLESQVEILQAAATQYKEVSQATNTSYAGSEDEIVSRILTLDQEWRTASSQTTLIQNVLNNDTSLELLELQQRFPDHVELFLTDKYGANIAATNQTSGYYQADEDWWRSTYNQGRGRVYISQPEFDESTQTFGLLIAIPIIADGEVVGILRSTFVVSPILENLQNSESSGNFNIDLRTSYTTFINGDVIPANELPGLNSVNGKYGEIVYKAEPSLVSEYRVFSSVGSLAQNSVSLLDWSVIVSQDLDVALQPVQQQTRTITLLAIVIMFLAGLGGYIASLRIAAPILTLTGIAGKISEGDLSIQAQVQTQDEIGELANSFNLMTDRLKDTLGSLERRVAERTADLDMARLTSDRRAQELQSISEISRAISTEQKLEILLPLVTRLVSERFDFYHIGIFFVDETRRFAFLQAANSEGGQQMLARGHRLDVGKGLVGTVAQTGKSRIALDVGSDAAFFDNPDLPTTRSEMALPLNVRGKTIGVLDVQSTKPGAFTESDANTLGILGDQVAIAIENARLFGQTQQAREEAEALYSQIQQQAWVNFSKQTSNIGYRQTSTGGNSITKPIETDESRQALENGQIVVIDGKGKSSTPTIAIPVKLRGQTLGVLNIKAPTNDRKWNQDEINLAQAISNRLALALDNARLLQESQRRAAKEVKIGEVTAKIGASINMRNVLQTAVEELGRALPGSEVVIQFSDNDQ